MAMASGFIAKGGFKSGHRWTIEGSPFGSPSGPREISYFSSLAIGAYTQLIAAERREIYKAVAKEVFKSPRNTHGIRFTRGQGDCLFVRACNFSNSRGLTTDWVFRSTCDRLATLAIDSSLPDMAQHPGRDSFLFWHSAIVAIVVDLYGLLDRSKA